MKEMELRLTCRHMRSCEVSEGVKYRRSRPPNEQAIWLERLRASGASREGVESAYGVLDEVQKPKQVLI